MGGFNVLLVYSSALDSAVVKPSNDECSVTEWLKPGSTRILRLVITNRLLAGGYPTNLYNASSHRNNQIEFTYYDETKKMAHDKQTARGKENPKLGHGGPSKRQAPCTNPPMEF